MKINFSETAGKIKYMNAVNNGPTAPNVRVKTNNFEAYKAAGISYARNHDASFCRSYGGEHTVDVHRIFKNFDADENDPANYIFEPTDEYLKTIQDAGAKVFYRLGASIEHEYKYGTRKPKDYIKWAKICEHIIRHYTEGWANGFCYDIEYWEIWNEPDCRNGDGTNPCWQGTQEEFIDFFCQAITYLKGQFPHLKIGGPAFCSAWNNPYAEKFLAELQKRNTPLDFFSFHWYGRNMSDFAESLDAAKNLVDKYGYNNAELILNEWNYIQGWVDEKWDYSIEMEQGLKGSSFIASAMAIAQDSALDMLMYYDARPCVMNGMFADRTYELLKGYFPFIMFKHLLELGTYVKNAETDEDVYACAATNGKEHAVMVSYYNNDDNYPNKQVKLEVMGLEAGTWEAEYYLLDENNDAQLVRSEKLASNDFSLYLNMTLFSTYLIKFKKID